VGAFFLGIWFALVKQCEEQVTPFIVPNSPSNALSAWEVKKLMGDFSGVNVTDVVPIRTQKVTCYDLHCD
jgi:hypothetical protein